MNFASGSVVSTLRHISSQRLHIVAVNLTLRRTLCLSRANRVIPRMVTSATLCSGATATTFHRKLIGLPLLKAFNNSYVVKCNRINDVRHEVVSDDLHRRHNHNLSNFLNIHSSLPFPSNPNEQHSQHSSAIVSINPKNQQSMCGSTFLPNRKSIINTFCFNHGIGNNTRCLSILSSAKPTDKSKCKSTTAGNGHTSTNFTTSVDPTTADNRHSAADYITSSDSIPNMSEAHIEELEKQLAETKNSLLRSLADAENTRKSHIRELQSSKRYCIAEFAKSIINVSDDLLRCLYHAESIVDISGSNESTTVNQLLKSINFVIKSLQMTNSAMHKSLVDHGIREILPIIGQQFDPKYHEAVQQENNNLKRIFDKPVQSNDRDKKYIITQIVQSGYQLFDRILRPAVVSVSAM